MPQIQCLPPHVADLIAAGEVVERPASVIKELLENAIDAGASAIVAEIEHGGLTYIRITDNGCGIPAEQLPTAFLRHATSKLRVAADLAAIGTLGTELCTVELWRVDASGRTVPVDVPQEPDIQEFFAKGQPVPDDVNPSVLICLGMGGLRAHPVFWNKTGMLYLPLANEIGYRWDGHRFQKVVRPHAEGSGEPADGLDIE